MIVALVFGALAISGWLFYTALVAGQGSDLIAAATYLLAIVFPILIVIVVIGGASFGEASIRQRTQRMLTETIPYHLQFLPEETRSFVDFRAFRKAPETRREELARIAMFYSKGRCYADYRITATLDDQDIALELRVELNVKRANVNVSVPIERIDALQAQSSQSEDRVAFLRSCFKHSLSAEAAEVARPDEVGKGNLGYRFKDTPLTRRVDGVDYFVIVATTALPDDAVWNPSERVFFAQDLMFMIRSFLQEYPALFNKDPSNA
ncbi:MAG: hypothetical protein AAF566_09270 [Pseudomonadota bacterium]